MKKVFTSAIALSFSLSVFAQTSTSENSPMYAQASEVSSPQIDLMSKDVSRKYFNANRQEVKSLDDAKFIEISKKNSRGLWDVAEFFANGFLHMEGTFLDKKLEVRSGKFKFYRPSGVLDYEGVYAENSPTGEWKFYFPNGQMSSLEVYENGNRVREEYWNEDGTSLLNKSAGERMLPVFDGGQLVMSDYLKKNLQYPAEAVASKTTGKVVVSFWVNEDGTIANPKIEESMGAMFDNAVLKMVTEMPKWLPAKHHNRPAKQMYILPVAFSYN
ncbi:MAG: TonB family protein [Emticicia sp.]|uniref:TonB family protein n=1 Tax=Emticicia sp. TaxID=1930953 RepID=UPI003BA47405